MSQRIFTTIGVIAAILLLAVLAGIVGVLYARPATAQTNVGVPGMRQITVIGRGEVQGRPDTAIIQIGVETERPSAQEALAQNTTQAQAIQQKLKDLGIAEKDIQTSNFSIYPVYNEDGRQVNGYRVSNSVTVKIRNLDQAGTLLDQVVQVGANQVYGINFSVDDPKALLDQARKAAMQDAMARAGTLAGAGNATVGDALVITENIGSMPPMPMPMAARADMAQGGAPVPVQPGEQTFSIDVQVTFALQ